MSDETQKSAFLRSRNILELAHDEARNFLLKPESYFSLDLPPYIVFDDLINGVDKILSSKRLTDLRNNSPRDYDSVNYTILHNKDGKYSWRPFQLIHPALYISLVNEVTLVDNWQVISESFRKFACNNKLNCMSLPIESVSAQTDRAEQVTHWWQEIEQRSIELSLDYEYLIQTDITDCYGAIYTHL